MDTRAPILQAWDKSDLPALLRLEAAGPGRYRNRHGDANLNGRSYGGQGLGQALMAASLSVPSDRVASAMQFMFLQGSMPEEAIDFEVTALQDGKRFSSRHVRGRQGARIVFDAQVSFAVALEAPAHETATTALECTPDDLPALSTAPSPWEDALRRLGGYSLRENACMEFRVPAMDAQLAPEAARHQLRFWLKARQALPRTPGMHASAFAYMSDWWLNFSCFGGHMHEIGAERRLYISSLNHCIWFHRPFDADQWLHFDSASPCAARGRGLAVARVHDLGGRLVASATQECLMAFA
ncbi:acyl-CoA thioesterase domain-containing protein [Xylophilus sp. GW821-FHT01B05]